MKTRQFSILSGIALATSGMVFGLCLPSSALTWNWSYSGDATTGLVGGSGTFTTTDGPEPFTITGITGTIETFAITSLLSPGTFFGNDNLLSDSPQQLTANGFSFEIAGAPANINIAFIVPPVGSASVYAIRYVRTDGDTEFVGPIDFSATQQNQPPAGVPEPSLLLSFITLGGLMLGGTVRRVRQ